MAGSLNPGRAGSRPRVEQARHSLVERRLRRASLPACAALACALSLACPLAHAGPRADAGGDQDGSSGLVAPSSGERTCGDPPKDGILVVNGVALPSAAVEDMLKAMRPPEGASAADQERQREAAIAALIEQEVLRQACEAAGIVVADAEIDAALGAEVRAAGGEPRLRAQLARRGLDMALHRRQLVERIRLERHLEAVGALKITEEALQEFFERNQGSFIRAEEALAAHILIAVPSTGTARDWDQAFKKIKKIHKMAQAHGTDFAALAQAHSEDPSAASGGDLGWFRRGVMVQPFEEAAFNTSPGAVSAPIQTQFGWHIVKVYGHKSPVGSFEEARDEVRRRLIEDRVLALRAQTLQSLVQKARIERR